MRLQVTTGTRAVQCILRNVKSAGKLKFSRLNATYCRIASILQLTFVVGIVHEPFSRVTLSTCWRRVSFIQFHLTDDNFIRYENDREMEELLLVRMIHFFSLAWLLFASVQEERKFVHCAMRSVPRCAVPPHEQQRDVPPPLLPHHLFFPTPKLRLLQISDIPFKIDFPAFYSSGVGRYSRVMYKISL